MKDPRNPYKCSQLASSPPSSLARSGLGGDKKGSISSSLSLSLSLSLSGIICASAPAQLSPARAPPQRGRRRAAFSSRFPFVIPIRQRSVSWHRKHLWSMASQISNKSHGRISVSNPKSSSVATLDHLPSQTSKFLSSTLYCLDGMLVRDRRGIGRAPALSPPGDDVLIFAPSPTPSLPSPQLCSPGYFRRILRSS